MARTAATGPGLTGMTVGALEPLLGSRTRALTVAKWIYGPRPWSAVLPTTLPGVDPHAWSRLRAACPVPELRVIERVTATDGTIKLLIGLEGGSIETVVIPGRGRSTVCVSSQIGCTRGCTFCATATLGFARNLRADEIVAQYLIARALAPAGSPATNVVFMGMGEPMDNLDEVLAAVDVLTQSPAPQLGHAQITVSTSGVLPGMQRFLAESRASLALSLNASGDAQRSAVMPHNKTWPIARLLGVLRADRPVHPERVHFIEYVVFDGVNDSVDDAERVVELLAGINARLNLIPHNPIADARPQPPGDARIEAFRDVVAAAGIRCFVRRPRGRDIAAACGQLARIRPRVC